MVKKEKKKSEKNDKKFIIFFNRYLIVTFIKLHIDNTKVL